MGVEAMDFSQREALDTGASAEDENPKLVWGDQCCRVPGPLAMYVSHFPLWELTMSWQLVVLSRIKISFYLCSCVLATRSPLRTWLDGLRGSVCLNPDYNVRLGKQKTNSYLLPMILYCQISTPTLSSHNVC